MSLVFVFYFYLSITCGDSVYIDLFILVFVFYLFTSVLDVSSLDSGCLGLSILFFTSYLRLLVASVEGWRSSLDTFWWFFLSSICFCREYLEFMEAIDVNEAWLGFLCSILLSAIGFEDCVIVFLLLVSNYFNIFVLDDRLRLAVFRFCWGLFRLSIVLTFSCALINPNLKSDSYSSIPAIKDFN